MMGVMVQVDAMPMAGMGDGEDEVEHGLLLLFLMAVV
jgi:hypothetical protein